MTDRISSFQSSPATTFVLEGDATADASYGSNGRWRIRCYLRSNNGPGGSTGSQYGGSGTHQGRVNGSTFATHSGNPFLPSGYGDGAQRWRDGPYDVYVNANANGYWSGTSTSISVQMALAYGSVNTTPSGSVPLPRIARAPGAPGGPTFSALTATSATLTWAAAARGNANISNYQWQIATNNAFTGATTVSAGAVLTDSTVGNITLLPATTYYARVRATNGDGTGAWSAVTSMTTAPAAPGSAPTPGAITINSIAITWTSASNGAALTGYDVQYALDAAFTTGVVTANQGTTASRTLTALTPGQTYYIRVRAKTAAANSAWSPTLTQATLPAVAPGLVVTAQPSGTSAVLTMSQTGSVDSYAIQRRVTGTTTPVTDLSSPTSPYTATGLAPGGSYDWRVSSLVGAYQSPWSAWQTVVQPKPNTSPGDFFDGNSTDTADVDFVWNGTTNLSTSKANGKSPTGWRTFAQGAAVSGGTGVVQRVTGGINPDGRSFGAQVTFWTPTTATGFHAGTAVADPGLADVAEGGVYWGSVWVEPSVVQRMAAEIIWFNAAKVVIPSPAVGAAVVVQNDGDAVRLVVQGTAPAGAEWAAVGWVDVAGTSHVLFAAGDTVLMDKAMITVGPLIDYFDGSTPDTLLFDYAWLGTTDASASTRTTLAQATLDPLADPDCPPVPTAPRPPVVDDACITDVGTWRRYWAIIPAQEVSRWLSVVPTVTVTTAAVAARQVRIRFYRNPDDLAPADFDSTVWESEQIVSYLPPLTALSIDGIEQRAWASVNGAPRISADRLLYGTDGTPATWPVLTCGDPYLISFDVPLDAPDGNLAIDVALTQRAG